MAARILILDSDPVLRVFLARLLRRAGHSVLHADTINLAARHLRTTAVDIVATDPHRTNSGNRCSRATLQSAFPGPAFISISAAPQSTGYLRLAATLDANALLAEPYLSRDLRDLMVTCLRR